MANILFRADSSSTIGTGHIMRNLVLAKQYPNSEIIFATQELEGNLNTKILEEGYGVKVLKSNNLDELINLVKRLHIDMIIIDHYEIDYFFEKELKEKTDIKIMVLDDTYEKHCCDVLLNHNIYADETRYKELVPSSCELRCGHEYTLIRNEFIIAKKNNKALPTQQINILLAMGGSDSKALNIPILKILNQFSEIYTHVVSTQANTNLAILKKYTDKQGNITLHINSNQIAQLMAKSHMAIITPSVILNEAYFMKLLFIPIQTADNQKEMVSFLESNDYPILKEFNEERLCYTLEKFILFYKKQHLDKKNESYTN